MQKAKSFSVGDDWQCFLCNLDVEMPEYGYQHEGLLRHLYEEDRLERLKIAELFDRSGSTIQNWLSKYDIKRSYKYEMPKDELRKLYLEEKMSIGDISDYYGCSYLAVYNRLDNYGIETRSQGQQTMVGDGQYQDEGTLRELYLDEKLSKMAIAEKFGVTESCIQHWIDKYDIPTRSYSEAQTERRLRGDEDYKDEDILRELYWEEQLTQRQIAERLDTDQAVIQRWMKKYDIELRHTGQEGEFYETKNGEYVRSGGERRIADFLYNHDIDYEYEPQTDIPLRPDFRVGDKLVEYWGMISADWYCGRMVEKMEEYGEHDEDIIGIYPDDLSALEFNFAKYC